MCAPCCPLLPRHTDAGAAYDVPAEIRSAVHESWLPFFAKEVVKPYWPRLQAFVADRRTK